MSEPGSTIPIVFNNCISVKGAAFHSGYNMQYLRRMLRSGVLGGVKIGQIWLIEMDALETYLNRAENTYDRRWGPKQFFYLGKYTNVNTLCIRL
jgi:hypothetical protein